MICDNTHIRKIPSDVFKINSYPEDFTDCQEIDVLDLSSWKDEPESATKGTSGLRSVKNEVSSMPEEMKELRFPQ